MFYNTKTNELLNECPPNGYLPVTEMDSDGNEITRLVLIQGLSGTDFETRKACGILPVKSDSPNPPENSIEDINQRNIVIENDGVIVTRVYVPIPVVIPSTISARQIRLWLVQNNISLTSIENAINGITDELLREKTLVEWEYAPYVERNHPMLETLGQILGLNSNQIDQAFIEAANL
jgi:hypothetical protein